MLNKINLFLLISFLSAIAVTGWFYYQLNNRVGEIVFNRELDDAAFKLCSDSHIGQEYNPYGVKYRGGKKAVKREILEKLQSQQVLFAGSGLITFRFVVNCRGEAGRYRVKSIDENLEEKEFDPQQMEKLLVAVAKLEHWQPGEWNNEKRDSYGQVHFKIHNGKITDIF